MMASNGIATGVFAIGGKATPKPAIPRQPACGVGDAVLVGKDVIIRFGFYLFPQ